jgi:predicted permease
MDTLWQDFRYGVRLLVKSPAFAAVAVVSLALGIGANTTIFTLVNALFLKPLPVEEPSRVMMIYGTDASGAQGGALGQFLPISRPNFLDYREKNQTFSGTTMMGFAPLSLSGTGDPEQINGQIVSGNYFDVLGIKAAVGRTFLPEEDSTFGTHPVVVLSHGLWKRRFGSDPNLVGRTVILNRVTYNVIGIAPENFRGTFAFFGGDAWIPVAMHKQVFTGLMAEWFDNRRALIFLALGRLKPGVAREQAQAEMSTIGSQLEQAFPRDNEKRNVQLVPLPETTINPNARQQFVAAGGIMMGAVGLVLLIACTNVANLLLARSAAREREIGIRVAMGAGRGRLLRQLLTESLVLAVLAGALGLIIAFWARDLLWAFRPPFMAQNAISLDLSLDPKVLGFTIGLSLLTGLIFGVVPAVRASRPDLVDVLKERSAQSRGLHHLFGVRSLMVMAQVALSLVALVGSGLFLRSLWNAQQIDPGFEAKNLLVLNMDLGTQGYDAPRGREFYRQVIEKVNALPMVQAAGLSTNAPFAGGFMRTVFPQGVDTTDRRNGVLTPFNSVDVSYFEAMGIPILRGRGFAPTDTASTTMVAVINEALAKRIWPNAEPIGQRFTVFGEAWVFEVVGVARHAKYQTLGEEPQPIVYVPLEQHYMPGVTLHVRTKTDPAAAVSAVRGEVQAMDRNMPLTGVNTMAQIFDQVLWAPRMGATLLGVFGFLALFLASLGIYGVMSYSVTQRTHEIGIRMALGAQTSDVLRLILGQGALIAGIGVVAGLGVGFALTRVAQSQMAGLLFNVKATDPVTFAGTAVVLGVVALVASYLPARRATRVDPMVALRYE